jgi:hypothetical protein
MKPDPGQTVGYRMLWRFLLVVALVFLARSLWTFPVEHTDAMQKLYYAGEIVRTGNWQLLLTNHHTMRWAAMLPEVGLVRLLGNRYEVLLALPMLAFSLYWTLILFCLRHVLRPAALILLGALLFMEPFGFFMSNSFLVSGLGVLFAVAGACQLVRHRQGGLKPVMLAALFFFCAYGSHATYLSFAAGGFLWLLVTRRTWPKVLAFAGVIISLLVLETLLFNMLSGGELTLGRFEALASGDHIERKLVYEPVLPIQFITRWLFMPWPHVVLWVVFLAAGVWYLAKGRSRDVPGIIQCLYLVGLCYALAVSFPILSLDPLRTAMPLRPRFLVPFWPFAVIVATVACSEVVRKFVPSDWRQAELRLSLLLALGLISLPSLSIGYYQERIQAFVWRADRQYSEFSRTFADGGLLFTGNNRHALEMLARFKTPAQVRFQEQGIYAGTLRIEHHCVERLNQVPIDMNYHGCETVTRPE